MEKRTVVITGGNLGLGYQCAKNIAPKSEDYTVVLVCRNRDKATAATESLLMATSKAARAAAKGLMTLFGAVLGRLGSSTKSGKALAALITEPQYEGATGKYYDRGKEVKSSEPSYDNEAARKLWVESAELVQLKQDESILSIT